MPAELVVCYVHQQVSTHSMALSSLPMPPCATCNITRRPRCGRRASSRDLDLRRPARRPPRPCTMTRVLDAVDCLTAFLLAYVNKIVLRRVHTRQALATLLRASLGT